MSFKTKDGKTHQSSVLISENGLPVDSITTISGSYVFLEGVLPLTSYSGGVITLPAGYDLTPVTVAKARYTGKYILLTKDHKIYYIDRVSIDVSAGTFLVSTSDKNQVNPITIDLSAGWTIAEADIVNRLATTSSAKIDSVEFRDLHFQMQLDGDPVSLQDDDGHKLDINPDGSINIGGTVTVDIDLTDVENKLDVLIGEAQASNLSLDNIEASAASMDLKLEGTNALLTDIDSNIDNVNTNLTNIQSDTAGLLAQSLISNTHLQSIEDALAAPLQIEQPVITAGTSNGLASGPAFVHVNNVKAQILASHDREQLITYADFGTKNQRVIEVSYTSATFTGVTARKTITYTLVGNNYRRDSINWEIV